MLDLPLMLLVKLRVVERIHPRSYKFAMGVENKGTVFSELNDSPDIISKTEKQYKIISK